MPRIEIDTKKSAYEPVEIVVDGELYQVDIIPFGLLSIAGKLEKAAVKGDVKTIRKSIYQMIGLPEKVMDKIDIRDLYKIVKLLIDTANVTDEDLPAKEKNGSRPGDKK